CPGRHAPEQGRHRGRGGGDPARGLLQAGAPGHLRRRPGPVRAGEPADAVTVAAELDRRGDLRRAGGAPYLHTLSSTVPTSANSGYYAEIVAEKSVLRRLVDAGTRIVQFGYAGSEGADVAEVVDRAQAEIFEVTERRTTEDFVIIEELLQ